MKVKRLASELDQGEDLYTYKVLMYSKALGISVQNTLDITGKLNN